MIRPFVLRLFAQLVSPGVFHLEKAMACSAVADLNKLDSDQGLTKPTDRDGTSSTEKSLLPESAQTKEETTPVKRPHEETSEETKKLKTGASQEDGSGEQRPFRKKKVAMLMVYSGKGYLGMQRNPGFHTIEEDLLSAMVKAGVVTPDHITQPGIKMGFQRASRTDKGVSAAGQVCSLKINVENAIEKINSHLPDQIRVLGVKRTTKGFNSKNACMARTYIYLLPTMAFAPIEEVVTEEYRVTSCILKRVNEILSTYKGTHNFHNFTSGKRADDVSAKRYIISMECGEPFVRDNIEYAVITVKGQSFMLHQIRKLIGLTIAIVKGLVGMESIDKAWLPEKRDIPKAPGLGLMLDKLHYDAYNKKYGSDGMHEPINWDEYKDEIDEFKEKFIFKTIYDTEKTEKSMLSWLSTLPLHHFDILDDEIGKKTPLVIAAKLVESNLQEQANSSDDAGNISD